MNTNNPSELANNKAFANLYEQIMLQKNMSALQHQQQKQQQQFNYPLSTPFHGSDALHLQIHPHLSKQTSPTSSSYSSLLSISSSSSNRDNLNKSEQVSPSSSPNDSGSTEPTEQANIFNPQQSNNNKNKVQNIDYEAKYRAYMMNAAAAFPYSMLGIGQNTPSPNLNQNNFVQPILNHLNNRQLIMENFSGFFPPALFQQKQQQNQQAQQSAEQMHQYQAALNNQNQMGNDSSNCCRMFMKQQEEPKPAHSYIGLIALAILSTPEKKLVLSDIYQWILDNYSYFHSRGSGWRNSIRHNLSLNDCFMKSGRSSNGKGHYWTIHPANLEDFSRGDFRRRRAQRRVRKSLGLTLPEEDAEDDEDNELLTPPSSLSPINSSKMFNNNSTNNSANSSTSSEYTSDNNQSKSGQQNLGKRRLSTYDDDEYEIRDRKQLKAAAAASNHPNNSTYSVNEDSSNEESNNNNTEPLTAKLKHKRSFNVDSLLAPESNNTKRFKKLMPSLEELSKEESSLSSSQSKPNKSLTTAISNVSPILAKTSPAAAGVKIIRGSDQHQNSPFSKVESDNVDVEKWKQTFNKIMARSYKNNANGINNKTEHDNN